MTAMNPIWLFAFIPLIIAAGWFFKREEQRKLLELRHRETEYILHRLASRTYGDWK